MPSHFFIDREKGVSSGPCLLAAPLLRSSSFALPGALCVLCVPGARDGSEPELSWRSPFLSCRSRWVVLLMPPFLPGSQIPVRPRGIHTDRWPWLSWGLHLPGLWFHLQSISSSPHRGTPRAAGSPWGVLRVGACPWTPVLRPGPCSSPRMLAQSLSGTARPPPPRATWGPLRVSSSQGRSGRKWEARRGELWVRAPPRALPRPPGPALSPARGDQGRQRLPGLHSLMEKTRPQPGLWSPAGTPSAAQGLDHPSQGPVPFLVLALMGGAWHQQGEACPGPAFTS